MASKIRMECRHWCWNSSRGRPSRINRPLPIPEALETASQIADALEAAHERGVIHRDLKPANIKLTANGVVKVLDFGLAKPLAGSAPGLDPSLLTVEATREGAAAGTAAYMSPEQARGQAIDRRTDVWSFGCVVFEMLSGQRAFAGATVSDTLASVLTRDPKWDGLPSSLSPPIMRLLVRCLEKDLTRRLRDSAMRDSKSRMRYARRTLSKRGPHRPAV